MIALGHSEVDVFLFTAQAAAPQKRNPQTDIPFSVAATYKKSGVIWRMIIVKPGLSDVQLISLARRLHASYPNDSAEIFDNESQVQAYVNWDVNYPSRSHPYPEGWLKKHDIACVIKMLDGRRGAKWQLLGGSAHPKADEKIADLE
jgi:hypothetical protein